MKSLSYAMLRPLCLLIFLMIVVLSLAGFLIPMGIKRAKRIEYEAQLVSVNINHEVLSGFRKTAALFAPYNASAIKLGKLIHSSMDDHEFTKFSNIQKKVAPKLFQALATIPYLMEISYVGIDGLLFAYQTEGHQIYALYSNSTLSNPTSYTWYKQPANHDNGNLVGEPIVFRPLPVLKSSWFQRALKNTEGYASVGTGLLNSSDTMLVNTVALNGKGVISLTSSMKQLIEILASQVAFYDGGLYLATKDGNLITQGLSNTHVVPVRNQNQFQVLGLNNDLLFGSGDLPCISVNGTIKETTLRIQDEKYVLNCSPVDIAGAELVYVVALPDDELSSVIHRTSRLAFILLILMIGAIIITLCTFLYVTTGASRREMCLRRGLIKQMESTEQAERKSMNKSLAFASASHDIRASLAGITGLIEISLHEVSKWNVSSEFRTNLLQMKTCTKDLLGILNTILDTTKIEAGKMHLEVEEFEMEQLLEDVVDLFHPTGAKKGVDVILDPFDGSITKFSRVKGDQGKLKQILSNLLSNAVKFTSEGYVTVRAWARKPTLEKEILSSNNNNSISCLFCLFSKVDEMYSESEVVNAIQRDPNYMEFVFEVNDSGKGIPKEKKNSVFENYVQVKETGEEGTGLGLGIVQSLVRLMGGEIRIVDKEVGDRGTLFRLNVFLSTTETNASTNAREADVEAIGDLSSNSPHQSGPIIRNRTPKSEGSRVILLIQNSKRSLVIQNFMERLGIKVHVVKEHEQLSRMFQKVKSKLSLSRGGSSRKSDMNSRSDGCMSSTPSFRSKELPLSAQDGTDGVVPSQRKPNDQSGFVLIVIDKGAGPFGDISRLVAEFRNDLINICNSAVVWLDSPSFSSNLSLGFNEDRLPPSDLILSKPFHGSRLYQVIRLLPEFHSTMSPRSNSARNISPRSNSALNIGSSEASTSDMKVKVSVMNPRKDEIEEVEGSSDKRPLTGTKVLLADDSPIARKIAMSCVQQLGATVFSCENGEEACKLVYASFRDRDASTNSLPFDYILMDCEMPVMNGTDATRRIREIEKEYGLHIPILALTAHEKGEEMDMMMEAGVDGFLTKPLRKEALLKAISQLY